jgi:hypothetical protein
MKAALEPKRGREVAPRRWLFASLVVNVLLASYLLRAAVHRPAGEGGFSKDVAVRPSAGGAPRRATQIPAWRRAVRGSIWSRIESTNLDEYVANLRRVGCPDETVCDIVRPASERAYAAAVARTREGGDFWASGSERRALAKAARPVVDALRREEEAFLSGLACLQPFGRNFEENLLLDMVFGFAGPVKRDQVLSLVAEHKKRAAYWAERCGGVRLPADVAAMKEEEARFRQRWAATLSEAELEEFRLRVAAVHASMSDSGALEKLHLSPSEFREYAKIRWRRNGDEDVPGGDLTLGGDEPEKSTDEEMNAAMRRLLGENRFNAFRTSSEQLGGAVNSLLTEFKAPVETAARVTGMIADWRDEVAAYRKQWDADPAAAGEALRNRRDELRQTMESLLQNVPEERRARVLTEWVDDIARNAWISP